MSKIFARFRKDESGATAIEYGLIAALISVALIAGASALGNNISGTFNTISGKMGAANTAGAARNP
ncbi:Flp family type IVb pilin [Aliirhizobium terrae]|uniref:Flp family type IVb pilin n=1 Tax=Terrirhizobium terrae TaxID=2926709 RepID=UPI00257669D5|nr:Flp family type IVb pilin [Rhizobium sp. CC-CFT758]WJH41906.1 Flp family type IVb pilin [Rhizobium sp. CC-CFT758]